jgi:hypothetical protein
MVPPRFEISPNFVGDFDRLIGFAKSFEFAEEGQDHVVLDTIGALVPDGAAASSGAPVPTPDELGAKKLQANVEPEHQPAPDQNPITEEQTIGAAENAVSLRGDGVQLDDVETVSEAAEDQAIEREAEPERVAETGIVPPAQPDQPEPDPSSEQGELTEAELAEVQARLQTELGAEEVLDAPHGALVCEVCHVPVTDDTIVEISKVRAQKILCKDHLREHLQAAKRGV